MALSFESKNLHLGSNSLEFLHNSKNLVKFASCRHKSHAETILKCENQCDLRTKGQIIHFLTVK